MFSSLKVTTQYFIHVEFWSLTRPLKNLYSFLFFSQSVVDLAWLGIVVLHLPNFGQALVGRQMASDFTLVHFGIQTAYQRLTARLPYTDIL